jgi:hypothetical protein
MTCPNEPSSYPTGERDLQVRTKPTMGKRMLRSALVAVFSAVVAFGALNGLSDAKDDVRADTSWPVAAGNAAVPPDTSWPAAPADPVAPVAPADFDTSWPAPPVDGSIGG